MTENNWLYITVRRNKNIFSTSGHRGKTKSTPSLRPKPGVLQNIFAGTSFQLKISNIPSITEPARAYGEGEYALSAIKEHDVTEAFLAIKDKKDFECQNQESFQDCIMNEFLENGIQDCNCTPYNIRNYTRDVSVVFRLHYHTLP